MDRLVSFYLYKICLFMKDLFTYERFVDLEVSFIYEQFAYLLKIYRFDNDLLRARILHFVRLLVLQIYN